jgi:2-polyprenyl-3-methyl-5-hydroxy-6-metoxy-1,4-benzoquinol methylase
MGFRNWLKVQARGLVGTYWVVDSLREMRAQLALMNAEERDRASTDRRAIIEVIPSTREELRNEVARQIAELESRITHQLSADRLSVQDALTRLESKAPDSAWLVEVLRPLTVELADVTTGALAESRSLLESSLPQIQADLRNGVAKQLDDLRARLSEGYRAELRAHREMILTRLGDKAAEDRTTFEASLPKLRSDLHADVSNALDDLGARLSEAYREELQAHRDLLLTRLGDESRLHEKQLDPVVAGLRALEDVVDKARTNARSDLTELVAGFQRNERLLDALRQLEGQLIAQFSDAGAARDRQHRVLLDSVLPSITDQLRADLRSQAGELRTQVTEFTEALERGKLSAVHSELAGLQSELASVRSDMHTQLIELQARAPETYVLIEALRQIGAQIALKLNETLGEAASQSKLALEAALPSVRDEITSGRAEVRLQLAGFDTRLSVISDALENGRFAALESRLVEMRDDAAAGREAVTVRLGEIRSQLPGVLDAMREMRAIVAGWPSQGAQPSVGAEMLDELRRELTVRLEALVSSLGSTASQHEETLRAELRGVVAELTARFGEAAGQAVQSTLGDTTAHQETILRTELRAAVSELNDGLDQVASRLQAADSQLSEQVADAANTIKSQVTQEAKSTAARWDRIAELQRSHDDLRELYEIVAASHRSVAAVPSRISVETNKPVASESLDHLAPRGTRNDNSLNLRFNARLARWFPLTHISVLDLGCAGGGFVKSVLDMGCLAVGIEGSDYSKLRDRAEWATIPSYLFTADLTVPLRVVSESKSGKPVTQKFNVATAWEFFEHIPRPALDAVFLNISRHLAKDGILIASIAPTPDAEYGVSWHRTVETKEWWIQECSRHGLVHHEEIVAYFDGAWVRGGETTAPTSFHLVLTRKNDHLPHVERLPEAIRNAIARSP